MEAVPDLPGDDEPLLDTFLPDLPPEPSSAVPTETSPLSRRSNKPSSAPTSLFQSTDAETPNESESEDEPDLNRINESWADLMLQLDNLRIAGGSKKGKKGKPSGVIMETSEMRRLKDQISKAEKEYMFSRKEGGESR